MNHIPSTTGHLSHDPDAWVKSISKIFISSYEIVKDEHGAAKFVQYAIQFVANELIWMVARRYSDFFRLQEALMLTSHCVLPILPKKRIFGAFNVQFLEQRKADLQLYLRSLIFTPGCLENVHLKHFILDGYVLVSHPANMPPAAPVQPKNQVPGFWKNKFPPGQFANAKDRIPNGNGGEDVNMGLGELENVNSAVSQAVGGMDTCDDRTSHPMHIHGANIAGYPQTEHQNISTRTSSGAADSQRYGLGLEQERSDHAMTSQNVSQSLRQQQQPTDESAVGRFSSDQDSNMSHQVSYETNVPGVAKPKLEDFEMVRVLGKGSFGKVMLCRKRSDGKFYAMKVLKKNYVIHRKQVAHTRTERSVLGQVDHPFVVKLHYAFQTEKKLHFVLDFCSGGELFFHLGNAGRFSETLSRFYAAEISLALGHLHSLGIVYRDLKPENILLDFDGHVKLADFGLSKEGINESEKGTHSFCGTPEYLAPEVLNRTGHGSAVDWWSLGGLLYEMLTGLPPWYSLNRQKMFSAIRHSSLQFPTHISVLARLIMSEFLERNVAKRLGSRGDIDEIRSHPFFASIDWEKLYNRQIPSPFVPRLHSMTDTRNFDQQFTKLPVVSMDASSPSMQANFAGSAAPASHNSQLFDGFTYVEPPKLSQHFNAHRGVTNPINAHRGVANPTNTPLPEQNLAESPPNNFLFD